MANFSLNYCCKLWGDNDIDYFYSETTNGSGGILMTWHNKFFQCSNDIINRRFIVFSGFSKEKNIPVVIVNVYSSCNLHEKTQMWTELLEIRQRDPCNSWCILGDFNSIRNERERMWVNKASGNKREMQGYNNFIDNMEMVDIPCIGRKYTCYRPNGKARAGLIGF